MQDGERKIHTCIHFGVKMSKVKVTTELCQHFGSDTITGVVLNIQLSYFIHRCRMVSGRYLYILGSKGQGHNWTLSTLWFWHDNLSSFNVQLSYFISYFINRCRMVRGRYLYILGSKGQFKVATEPFWLCVLVSQSLALWTGRLYNCKEIKVYCKHEKENKVK